MVRNERHAEGRPGRRGEGPQPVDAGTADERLAVEPGHVGDVDVDRAQHAPEEATDDRCRKEVDQYQHVRGANGGLGSPRAGDGTGDPHTGSGIGVVNQQGEAKRRETVAARRVVPLGGC